MAVESVAECLWNGWPNQRGTSGRMGVEYAAYAVWFISLWCFFAALLSALVWLQFGRRRPAAPGA